MKDVFNVDESSELLSASSNRHAAPRSSSFDLHDAIVSSCLEHLAVEGRLPKDTTNDLLVEIESVGDDQGKILEIHPVGNVAQKSECISIASSPDDGRRPETRPNFDRGENPDRPVLASGEGANLVCLELFDGESGNSSSVEATARGGGLLKSARHGVPSETLDPSDRRDADALDSESNDRVERRPSMLKTVLRRAFRRRERLSALNAPVSTAFPGPRSVESVADDVSETDFAPQRAYGIETSAILHFGSALTTRELCLRNSGSNSSTQTG